jgi:hypothetical protein
MFQVALYRLHLKLKRGHKESLAQAFLLGLGQDIGGGTIGHDFGIVRPFKLRNNAIVNPTQRQPANV